MNNPISEISLNSPEPEEIKISQERNYYIVKRSDLIQDIRYKKGQGSGKALNLIEQKIILYMISHIKPEDNELQSMIFDIPLFCEVCGIKKAGSGYYKQIKKALDGLLDKHIWLTSGDVEESARWIEKVRLTKTKNTVEIQLGEELAPFLLKLRENYTKYSIHNILSMKSKYSPRLYEILKSNAFKAPVLLYDIEDLKEFLDATNYDNKEFKRRVLDPAIDEINEYTDLEIGVMYSRAGGKSVKYVKFIISDLNKGDDAEWGKRMARYLSVESDLERKTK